MHNVRRHGKYPAYLWGVNQSPSHSGFSCFRRGLLLFAILVSWNINCYSHQFIILVHQYMANTTILTVKSHPITETVYMVGKKATCDMMVQ